MARQNRVYGQVGCTYSTHIRINDEDVLRFQNRKIARLAMKVCKEARNKYNFMLILCTIMGNHLHIKLRPDPKGKHTISQIMHWINFMIAMRYNKETGHTGRLWRERFKSCVLHDFAYFMNTAAYIARNPERAGIASASEYPFGSIIFSYKDIHPFPEFEEFRHIFEEPFEGYFEQVKELIKEQQNGKSTSILLLSMSAKRPGRPKNVSNS